ARAAACPELGNSSRRGRGDAAADLSSAGDLGGGRNPAFEERRSAGALLEPRRDSRGHRPLRRARGPQEPGLTTGGVQSVLSASRAATPSSPSRAAGSPPAGVAPTGGRRCPAGGGTPSAPRT